MNGFGRLLTTAVCTLLLSAGVAGSASAQVCGDADANGSVTVTDGVQVLRAAAGLSSSCSDHASSCDVDGSGTVTVTDGVNVLRKAAGLSITEACPTSGGTADVQAVTDTVVPFLVLGLQQIPSVGSTGSVARTAASTENCEDGGSRTTSESGITISVVFSACRVHETGLGSFQFDGNLQVQLGIPNSSVVFELLLTDLSNNKAVDFDGTVQGTPNSGGGFTIQPGTLIVRGPNEGPEIFRLKITKKVVVDGNGHLVSGTVEADDTSDSFALQSAEVEVEDGSSTANVHVVRDDNSTQDYTLNLNTGDLTPV